VVFGKQRPAADLATLALLLVGFCGLAFAIFYLRETLIGALLPLTFIAGAFAGLRGEVREVELHPGKLILRTLFRSYTVPRRHVRAIVATERGPAIDVLSGARYPITPPGVDPIELERALRQWLESDTQ
jgi:hypothetical protein